MKLARQHFGIPLVLRPEDLASSELDELSAITYLSYFTKVGAPGYNATLQKIQPLVRTTTVFNFTVRIPPDISFDCEQNTVDSRYLEVEGTL